MIINPELNRQLMKILFQDDQDNPLELTDGQLEIANAITDPDLLRVWMATPTQYGKSLTVAASALLLKMQPKKKQKIIIIAPSSDQAKIIMDYIINFVLQNPIFQLGLINVEAVQRLKTQFSKDRLSWADGTEIRILTANVGVGSQNIDRAGRQLMGHGGTTIIIDEASLIPDIIMAKILRMLGKSKDGKLVLIGNPFGSGYFYQAYLSEAYHKIKIDWRRAVAEGRYTEAFVNEMRAAMSPDMFRILYEVNFVLGSDDSYILNEDLEMGLKALRESLLNTEWVAKQEEVKTKVGVDVARGGKDFTVILLRKGYKIIHKEKMNTRNTMEVANRLIVLHGEYNFDWEDVNIDVTGIGAGVVDRLLELEYDVNGVGGNEVPDSEESYYNKRAELWGVMQSEIRNGGVDVHEDEILKGQLVTPKKEYRNRKGFVVMKVESKEQMAKRGIKSPDHADALSLTYYEGKQWYFGSASVHQNK